MGNIFGGERVILVLFAVGLALVKANYVCSSEVNTNFNAFEAEVKTASDTGRQVTNILPSSDGLYFYVVSTGTTNVGSPTVYDNTIFEKRSGDSSVSWSKGYQYVVNQRSAALDDAEDYIYFAVNDGTKGYFGKIATADGSVSRFVQTDTGIKNCNGISYSGGYLYAQCTSSASGGTLTELDAIEINA